MSYDREAGSFGTREYLAYENTRANRAHVDYDYADESARQNAQAQREAPPRRSPQVNVGQSQNAAPRAPRPARGLAEYNTEIERAVLRGQTFGLSQNVDTGRKRPFEHLGESRFAGDLISTLDNYARESYSSSSAESSIVRAFLRQFNEIQYMMGHSWHGAELCAEQDLSGHWAELLNLFTGFLQGGNNFYDRIQTLVTNCEREMYHSSGRRRSDGIRRFMAAFIRDPYRERADLTGDMRD